MLEEITILRRFVTVLLIFISVKRPGTIKFPQDWTANLPNRHVVKTFSTNDSAQYKSGRSRHATEDRPER